MVPRGAWRSGQSGRERFTVGDRPVRGQTNASLANDCVCVCVCKMREKVTVVYLSTQTWTTTVYCSLRGGGGGGGSGATHTHTRCYIPFGLTVWPRRFLNAGGPPQPPAYTHAPPTRPSHMTYLNVSRRPSHPPRKSPTDRNTYIIIT